ncbi:MAG TPA: YkuS family protein [Calditerricola sp.]
MPRVAVEETLTHVEQALRAGGFEVVPLREDLLQQVDAVVISGQDTNLMGMADRQTEASVINAHGLTAEEVVQAVRERVRRMHENGTAM